MIKSITSIHNPLIKELAKLAKASERYAQRRFIAEGLRTCSTLIKADHRPEFCFVSEALLQEAHFFENHNPIVVSDAVLKKLSQASTPSGIVCIFLLPKNEHKNLETGLVLVDLHDPGNMGTLFRTCAAMNKKMVIVIDGVDPYHPKVVQASTGTLGLLTIVTMSWPELVAQARKEQFSLCALVARHGKSFQDLTFDKTLLVVGNEAHGLSDQQIADCDQRLTLAMPGKTESLNAAIAGSIALYLAWGINSKLK